MIQEAFQLFCEVGLEIELEIVVDKYWPKIKSKMKKKRLKKLSSMARIGLCLWESHANFMEKKYNINSSGLYFCDYFDSTKDIVYLAHQLADQGIYNQSIILMAEELKISLPEDIVRAGLESFTGKKWMKFRLFLVLLTELKRLGPFYEWSLNTFHLETVKDMKNFLSEPICLLLFRVASLI